MPVEEELLQGLLPVTLSELGNTNQNDNEVFKVFFQFFLQAGVKYQPLEERLQQKYFLWKGSNKILCQMKTGWQ